ncbi:Protein-arginine deiminase [Beauveria brongniartii RCEF 3172]|uniref:Protein-arginine deiminase n=1 Tax=Beauveria brongniartii RCEF 3172 TaxID=1081107 RepID=A0A167CGM6_9HYPO|nr:Protein-arginine deiminase [Beauveria brongniartii RCEF 3172]
MRPTLILGALHLSALSHGSPTNCKATAPGQTSVRQPSTAKDNFTVSILADTNRDGKVDLKGDTDTVGKETWTDDVGALFLANIVDTDRRCSSQITGACASELGAIFNATLPPETPVLDPRLPDLPKNGSMKQWLDSLDESQRSLYDNFLLKKEEYEGFSDVDRKISACNDASDDILRNATYLAPLRTRPIPGLGDSATGTITITRTLAASKVRLFYKQETDSQWVFITSNHTFGAQELKAGLELGIDARDVRRPGGWDGRATVQFRVKDQGKEAQDSVALRVAPVLTQHHGQVAKQLLTSQVDDDNGRVPAQDYFVEEFRKVSSSLGLQSPVHAFEGCSDTWTQDFFEPGYMSIPGPSGPVSLYIMIRSAQSYRQAGRKVFQDLRSNTVGAVQHLANGGTVDSTGNLETIPPYSYNGKSYPAGRTVLGSQTEEPNMVDFLEAQELQAPIHLNTSWLLVGHTDEFFQFLPANNTLGWVLMVDDPLAGLDMLLQAQQAGHGKDKAVSRPQSRHDPEAWYVTTTIDELLDDSDFATVQNRSFNSIADNIEILKRETGLTDADIIRLPGLYEVDVSNKTIEGPWKYAENSNNGTTQVSRRAVRNRKLPSVMEAGTPPSHLQQTQRRRRDSKGAGSLERRQSKWSRLEHSTVAALYPGTINSVVVDKKHIIAANPWGPIIDGHDVLRVATDEAYAKAGYTVSYVDDWFTHHVLKGEVHCGSNAIRHLPGDQWW